MYENQIGKTKKKARCSQRYVLKARTRVFYIFVEVFFYLHVLINKFSYYRHTSYSKISSSLRKLFLHIHLSYVKTKTSKRKHPFILLLSRDGAVWTGRQEQVFQFRHVLLMKIFKLGAKACLC